MFLSPMPEGRAQCDGSNRLDLADNSEEDDTCDNDDGSDDSDDDDDDGSGNVADNGDGGNNSYDNDDGDHEHSKKDYDKDNDNGYGNESLAGLLCLYIPAYTLVAKHNSPHIERPTPLQRRDKMIKAIRETNDRAFEDERLKSFCMIPCWDGVSIGVKS